MGLFLLLARSPRRFASAVGLFRNPRVPMHLKVIAVAAALAILSPLNILGDIPFLGLFDDAALLALLLSWFVRTAEPFDLVPAPVPKSYGDDTSRQTLMVSRSSIAR
jgi:uncharacterized membrane protein YkvA (DUF1232 family)